MTRPDPTLEFGWLRLDSDEAVLWHGRPRIQTVLPAALLGGPVALGLGAMVAVRALPATALVAAAAAVVPAFVQYLRVRGRSSSSRPTRCTSATASSGSR